MTPSDIEKMFTILLDRMLKMSSAAIGKPSYTTMDKFQKVQHWYECIHTIVSIYAWEYERMYNRYTTVIMSDYIGTTHLTQV